jgi:uncharacterized membrane protein
MTVLVLAFLIGFVSGLRALTGLTVVSWGARLGWLHLENTWLSFLGASITPYILSVLAIGELINDKMPKTPSRKAPPSFVIRIVMGAVSGGAVGASSQGMIGGLVAGALGAVAGTLGGYEARHRLVAAIGGKDLPIALLEDLVAVAGAFCIVSRFN